MLFTGRSMQLNTYFSFLIIFLKLYFLSVLIFLIFLLVSWNLSVFLTSSSLIIPQGEMISEKLLFLAYLAQAQ